MSGRIKQPVLNTKEYRANINRFTSEVSLTAMAKYKYLLTIVKLSTIVLDLH